MPINSFLYPAKHVPVVYDVANSVRLNPPSNDYFNRTPSSASNRRTFTLSFWIKRWEISSSDWIIRATNGSGNATGLYFVGTQDKINIYSEDSGSAVMDLKTYRVFRDVSAWYHIVIAFDTTQSTDTNRVKLYVNGVQDANFQNTTYPSQNRDLHINTDIAHFIATDGAGSSNRLGCYFSEFCLIDGQALDPTSFGEFDEDSGIWKPIDVSGLTFGTNGFYLDFEDSGALGDDVSGNGNDFTVNNLTAIDQSTDTCTNNFATLNPLAVPGASNTFSEGNLEITNSADANRASFSTIGVSSGKWYYECKVLSGEMKQFIGISKPQEATIRPGDTAGSYGYSAENGQKYNNDSGSSYGSSASSGDIIMVAFDADNGTIWVGKNGTWFNSATQSEIENGTTTNSMYSSITIDDFFMMAVSVEDSNIQMNFGSPMYSISSGNTDGNGYGNFEYAVPSGYYALNSKNLAEYG